MKVRTPSHDQQAVMNGTRISCALTWFLLHIFLSVTESQKTSSLGSCGEYQYQCDNGQCVKSSVQCDGARDCDDGSDETVWLCRKLDLKCPPSSFRCAYGACVDGNALCNGIKNCADNSDEVHPKCFEANLEPVQKNLRCDALYNFTCISGECVDSAAVCDGLVDCKDGSDETLTQCFNMTCQPKSFQCAYGGCIDGDKMCDGYNDCVDETDELPGFCTEEAPPVKKGSTVDDDHEGCPLPEQPRYGAYTLGGCTSGDESDFCLSEPGTKVQFYTQIIYDCKRGYVLPVNSEGVAISDSFCIGEKWSNNITCRKMCEPVFSETLDLKCDFYGKPVPCDQYTRPGTKLMPKCKPFYHPQEPVMVYRHTSCTNDGKWEDPLFKCIPDCGIAGTSTYKNKIANGITVSIGDHPWAVALYKNDSGTYKGICGGTIISYNLILTAAHCIFDDQTGELIPASKFEIVVGKLNVSWDSEEPYQQKIPVTELDWPRSYKGRAQKFEKDIAVLLLTRGIKFSAITMPACVDWKKKGTFHNGDPGYIAGWGNNKFKQQSILLQSAILPYKDLETCRSDLKQYDIERHSVETGFKEFLTFDKFCAGTDVDEENSVQPGDSGGGLTFVRNNQHFLFGILSNHAGSNDRFAVYTNVTEYIDWLLSNNLADTLI